MKRSTVKIKNNKVILNFDNQDLSSLTLTTLKICLNLVNITAESWRLSLLNLKHETSFN